MDIVKKGVGADEYSKPCNSGIRYMVESYGIRKLTPVELQKDKRLQKQIRVYKCFNMTKIYFPKKMHVFCLREKNIKI